MRALSRDARGSVLIITMVITAIITVMGVYLLDRVVPVTRQVRGIENSNDAYYAARSAAEAALYEMSRANPSYERTASSGTTTASGTKFSIKAVGTTIPLTGQGTSEYSPDWNRVGRFDPITLRIDTTSLDWNSILLDFRVPNVSGTGGTVALQGTNTTPVLAWSLAGSDRTLIGTGSFITVADINGPAFAMGGRLGISGTGATATMQQFYANTPSTVNGLGNCSNASPCFLKLTVNRDLLADPDWLGARPIPYLEYRITNLTVPIAQQYATLTSEGYYYGYAKRLTRTIQQFTTNTSLNFTVFQ